MKSTDMTALASREIPSGRKPRIDAAMMPAIEEDVRRCAVDGGSPPSLLTPRGMGSLLSAGTGWKSHFRKALVLVTVLGVIAFVPFQNPARAEVRDDKALHALFAREWEYTMEQSPTWASHLGDRRWNDRWNDTSLPAIERRHEHDVAVLAELRRMDRRKLPPPDQLNCDLFEWQYVSGIEGFQFREHLIPLTQREGIQLADELADALRFETEKDYGDWIARLRSFPVYMDQTIALMREGIRARMVLPKITARRIPAQIEKQVVVRAEESPFFKPFRKFPAALSGAVRSRLVSEGADAVSTAVIPAFRRFQTFFTGEYLPACYDDVGAWQMPDGTNYYAFCARHFTTTTLTPLEIHRIGLSEVARIRAEMEAVKKQAGFGGTLPEFFNFLRTDTRFQCATAAELLSEYRAMAKRIDPTLVKLFRTLPRTPYGVEPIPDNAAPDTTAAYYRQPAADGSRAGSYFVNTYRPETRYRWEMTALSLHEAVPGHHLQIALAMEQGELPPFRRHSETTAFVEGWALYAEHLGDELGLYGDPYARFGKLTYEMWRAVRLVVDTGIHQLHWSRDRAISFFRDNAPKGENDIVNEIDRYISWPGQALAYKIGELKIKELRSRAERELGAGFDVREFHDVVLLSGALPLAILEKRVDGWISGKK
jgi:uncharacterized protein (DUF885 family)